LKPFSWSLAAISASSAARSVYASATNGIMWMASEYRTALPDEKELAAEIERIQVMLQGRKRIALTSSEMDRMKKKTKR